MLKCPTCSSRIEPQDRFCSGCYTVFPTERRKRTLAAETTYTRTWKIPALVTVAVGGTWLAQIAFGNGIIEAAPHQSAVAAVQLKVNDWYERSLDFVRGETGTAPVFRLDRADEIPCDRTALCEVEIRFSGGDTATYLLERTDDGATTIWPGDARGTNLLKTGRSAEMVWREPDGDARSFPIKRQNDDRWSLDEVKLSPDKGKGKPSGNHRA